MGAATLDFEGRLDSVDWDLLVELQQNARLSYAELGRRVGLTSPAVAERMRRMEETGIVSGYRVDLNMERIGRPLQAVVRMNLKVTDTEFRYALEQFPEVTECVRVTGDDCHVMKVAVQSSEQLESLLDRLNRYGRTTTSIVLSTPLCHRLIRPPEPEELPGDGKLPRSLRVVP